jgi:acyl-CoA thioesterase FadM
MLEPTDEPFYLHRSTMLATYVTRLAWTLARSGGRTVAPLDEVRLPLRVWPWDIDPFMHLNNGRYLTLMDLGRFQLVARSGLLREMVRRRWWPTLGGAAIKFRRELRLLQRFELVSRFVAWDGKWFYIAQRFECGGEVHAAAMVRGVFRHRGRSLPCADVMATAGVAASPAPPPDLEHWLALMG